MHGAPLIPLPPPPPPLTLPATAGHGGGALEAASYSRTVGLCPTLKADVGLCVGLMGFHALGL